MNLYSEKIAKEGFDLIEILRSRQPTDTGRIIPKNELDTKGKQPCEPAEDPKKETL